MEILKEKYTITELSEMLGITDHALRYYEKEFVLTVPKDSRGRRYYTAELANIMYRIKMMRDEGMEIKAIKKMLSSESILYLEPEIIAEPEPMPLVPSFQASIVPEIKAFLNIYKEELVGSISQEVFSARDHLTREITKSKLELGACVENSVRKLESKMEKHFREVDRSIGIWREKQKKGLFKRFMNGFL